MSKDSEHSPDPAELPNVRLVPREDYFAQRANLTVPGQAPMARTQAFDPNSSTGASRRLGDFVEVHGPGYDQRSSVQSLTPSVEKIQETLRLNPAPRPMMSLMASATKVTAKQVADAGFRKTAAQQSEWQTDAWAMYDLVGELRFIVDNIAGRSGKAHFYVGELSEKALDRPAETENSELQSLLASIGDGQSGLSRIIERLVSNLKVTGEGWLAGIPENLMEIDEGDEPYSRSRKVDRTPKAKPQRSSAGEVSTRGSQVPLDPSNTEVPDDLQDATTQRSRELVDGYVWKMLSVSEVSFDINGQVNMELGPSQAEQLSVSADDIFLLRVHKPHPERAWQADSSTRANLSTLR